MSRLRPCANPKYPGKAFQTYQAALTMMALGRSSESLRARRLA
jgi:hypothetical protein